MPMSMFRLAPGQGMRYRVVFPAHPERAELALEAVRPDEGQAAELSLALVAPDGARLSSGRVPIDRGYLAILRELRQQLNKLGSYAGDLDLELHREGERSTVPQESSAGGRQVRLASRVASG